MARIKQVVQKKEDPIVQEFRDVYEEEMAAIAHLPAIAINNVIEMAKVAVKAENKIGLVKMVRSEQYDEPRTADVHPDEVGNYKSGGWTIKG